jgi:hypothetical protein
MHGRETAQQCLEHRPLDSHEGAKHEFDSRIPYTTKEPSNADREIKSCGSARKDRNLDLHMFESENAKENRRRVNSIPLPLLVKLVILKLIMYGNKLECSLREVMNSSNGDPGMIAQTMFLVSRLMDKLRTDETIHFQGVW